MDQAVPTKFTSLNHTFNGFFKLKGIVKDSNPSNFYARYSLFKIWPNDTASRELTILDLPLSQEAVKNFKMDKEANSIANLKDSNLEILQSSPKANFIKVECGQTTGQLSLLK